MAENLRQKLMSALHRPVYESRLRVLSTAIVSYLQEGDDVLDIGCGFGALGRALTDHSDCPRDVKVRGAERVKRGGEAIEVEEYDGIKLPYDDNAMDVTILADVLHHDEQPDRLLAEAARVSRRLVIIKDHKVDGLLAQQRISLMDWAANSPYGVPCLYRYPTLAGWHEQQDRLGLNRVDEHTHMSLYPNPYRWLFTPRLQYLAVLEPSAD
jgi:SAM-dependent methyltransferase